MRTKNRRLNRIIYLLNYNIIIVFERCRKIVERESGGSRTTDGGQWTRIAYRCIALILHLHWTYVYPSSGNSYVSIIVTERIRNSFVAKYNIIVCWKKRNEFSLFFNTNFFFLNHAKRVQLFLISRRLRTRKYVS